MEQHGRRPLRGADQVLLPLFREPFSSSSSFSVKQCLTHARHIKLFATKLYAIPSPNATTIVTGKRLGPRHELATTATAERRVAALRFRPALYRTK